MPPSANPDPSDGHHEGILERLDDFKDRIEDAAIRAEYETGERESSDEEAKAHALVRVGRMTLGFTIVIIGIIALPLPGPGWLIIAGGLTILSKDVAWAERLLRYIRKRVPGIPEDGKIPRSSMATMAVMTLAFVSASLWWTLGRGSDEIQAGTYAVATLTDATASVPVDEPGIEIVLPADGPVSVRADSCDPIDFGVTSRSKETFVLAGPTDPDWSCDSSDGASLIDRLSGAELQLAYSTDGLVNWFFDDDQLSSIAVDADDGALRIDIAPS